MNINSLPKFNALTTLTPAQERDDAIAVQNQLGTSFSSASVEGFNQYDKCNKFLKTLGMQSPKHYIKIENLNVETQLRPYAHPFLDKLSDGNEKEKKKSELIKNILILHTLTSQNKDAILDIVQKYHNQRLGVNHIYPIINDFKSLNLLEKKGFISTIEAIFPESKSKIPLLNKTIVELIRDL